MKGRKSSKNAGKQREKGAMAAVRQSVTNSNVVKAPKKAVKTKDKPFIPNKRTAAAIKKSHRNEGGEEFDSLEALFESWKK
jgi:hypothetical protein